MVVLMPLFDDEEIRVCSTCPRLGLASPIRERSSFLRRPEGRFKRSCRICNSRAASKRQRRRLARETPEKRAVRRAQQNRWSAEEKARDPESFATKHREAQRRYVERHREDIRIDQKLRSERSGKALPSLGDVERKHVLSKSSKPVGPFRAWVEELIQREAIVSDGDRVYGRVADSIGVSVRTLYKYLSELDVIDEAAVDRAASRYGGITADEIYRDYPKKREARKARARRKAEKPARRTCGSPGCPKAPDAKGRFCGEHAERLARIKAALDEESGSFKDRIKRKDARPTCCALGCAEPRYGTDRFCDRHIDEGYTEDDYE